MIQRCTNPNNPRYARYGGRGIAVCERWRSFESFLQDMGPRPEGKTLDRVNVDGDYEPGNCRWATPAEQNRNMKRNRVLEWNGRSLCVCDWAKQLGISPITLRSRLRLGWTVEQALTIKPSLGNSKAANREVF
jgi:hypothetical protein